MKVYIKILPIVGPELKFIFWTKKDASDFDSAKLSLRDMTNAFSDPIEIRIQKYLNQIFDTECEIEDLT